MPVFETRISTRRFSVLLSCVSGSLCSATSAAEAHVKWFAPFQVADQPRLIEKVLCPDFAALSVLALALLVLGWMLDRTTFGEALSRAFDRITLMVRKDEQVLVRATCAFFLISIWTLGGTLLTPELKTSWAWVSELQLAMAATLLTRRTTFLAGLGIVVLYGVSISQYGIFHLLDYPIFLGVALYLVACSFPSWLPSAIRPTDLLRWAASVTLMWASIEKWAYPEWTLPIYIQHPDISMGYNFELFMQAAGVIEFTLAFALLGPSLVRRSAGFMLIGTFVSATLEFGKLDVIGHSVIIAVLFAIVADAKRAAPQALAWRGMAMPALAYSVALIASLSLYYGMHALLFHTAMI